MKKLKKLFVALAVSTVLITAVSVNASAATLNDGYATDLDVVSQSDSSAQVEAIIENANAYNAEGLNYSVSVSDNAEISGDTSKSDVSINSEADDKLNFTVTLKETSPAEEPTEATASTEATKSTDATSSTTPVTTAAASTQSTTKAADNTTVKTGSNDVLPCIAIIGGIAFVGLMIISFKRKDKRMLSLVLCGTITLSAFAVAIQPISASALESSEKLTVTDTLTLDLNGEQVDITLTFEYPKEYEVDDNSLAEITAINDGVAPDAYFNNNSKLSFLSGKFTDYKVINEKTAASAYKAVQTLAGLNFSDVATALIHQKTATNGDTYYTFAQLSNNIPIDNSYIIIGADSEGNVISVSSSLDLTADKGDTSKNFIDLDTAKSVLTQVLQSYYPTMSITEFLDDVGSEIVMHPFVDPTTGKVNYRYTWKFYFKVNTTNNYTIAYIDAVDGTHFDVAETASLPSEDGYENDYVFNVSTTLMTFTDISGNEVQLPVAEEVDSSGNKTGNYYFIDTERRIVVQDYTKVLAAATNPTASILYSFASATDANPRYVSAFSNMQKVYDYYKDNFCTDGIDDEKTPIALQVNYQINGEDVQNAAYYAVASGYHTFVYGNFDICSSLDVAGHEFTHGLKNSLAMRVDGVNYSGTIDESYGDIMGNLIQMILEPETADTDTWDISETINSLRSMGDPHKYGQPEYVGDTYYSMLTVQPNSEANDSGAVHQNDSILDHICYNMNKELGIGYEDLFQIWGNSIFPFTPKANYADILGYVKHSMNRNGYSNLTSSVQTIFENANIYAANTFSWENAEINSDAAMIEYIATDSLDDGMYWNTKFIFYADNGSQVSNVSSTINDQLSVGVINIDDMNKDEAFAVLYIYQDNVNILKEVELVDEVNCSMERVDNKMKITFSLQEILNSTDEENTSDDTEQEETTPQQPE